MGSNTTGGTATPVPVTADAPMVLPGQVLAAFDDALMAVPESGEGGMASILLAIAQATDPLDVDAPWRTSDLTSLVNIPLRISGVRRAPSDFDGGLGWFLIVDAANIATGELVTITAGAVAVVGQLVKLHALDAFPVDVVPRESPSKTPGRSPSQHLEIVRVRVGRGS